MTIITRSCAASTPRTYWRATFTGWRHDHVNTKDTCQRVATKRWNDHERSRGGSQLTNRPLGASHTTHTQHTHTHARTRTHTHTHARATCALTFPAGSVTMPRSMRLAAVTPGDDNDVGMASNMTSPKVAPKPTMNTANARSATYTPVARAAPPNAARNDCLCGTTHHVTMERAT